jgi:16S rRNA (cytosine1402-N4)-methyltransferase
MNRNKGFTAKDIVNDYSVHQLKEIFQNYGELKNAWKISQMIETARKEKEISTTNQLKEILAKAAKAGQENKFFARVFQALRIEVNDELGSLKDMLIQASGVLAKGGRLVVISYHSLEDRLVKNFMKSGNFEGKIEKDFYGNPQVDFRMITRKPLVPDDDEILRNNRARSAKLRIAEKI